MESKEIRFLARTKLDCITGPARGEKRVTDTSRWGRGRVTGEVRPQEGNIGNSKDFSSWASDHVPGSWGGSTEQG